MFESSGKNWGKKIKTGRPDEGNCIGLTHHENLARCRRKGEGEKQTERRKKGKVLLFAVHFSSTISFLLIFFFLLGDQASVILAHF